MQRSKLSILPNREREREGESERERGREGEASVSVSVRTDGRTDERARTFCIVDWPTHTECLVLGVADAPAVTQNTQIAPLFYPVD